MTIKIGVVGTALNDDAREAARLAREAKFDGLLFDAYSAQLNFPELSGTGRREFRHLLSTQAQALVGLRADLGPKGLGLGADIDRLLHRFDLVLHTAADLAASVVCVDLGPLPAPVELPKPKPRVDPSLAGLIILPSASDIAAAAAPPTSVAPPPDPALVSQIDTALSALGEIADRYRMTVALSTSLASYAALDRALTAARCPWFGVDLDPVAILADAWPLDEIFSRLGPLVRHIRARDAVLGADRRTRPAPIGQGSVNWDELSAALESGGYHGWMTVDAVELADRRLASIAGLARLRELR